ncbi:hypothetical protein ABPG74_011151 [Tetrahymena malaccensis]
MEDKNQADKDAEEEQLKADIKNLMFNKQHHAKNFFLSDSVDMIIRKNIIKLIEQELELLQQGNIQDIVSNIDQENKKEMIENELKNAMKNQKGPMEQRKSQILRSQWIMNTVRNNNKTQQLDLDQDEQEINQDKKRSKGSIESIDSEDEDQIIIQGKLMKKNQGLLNRWKKYFCTLNDEKFSIYEEKKDNKNQLDYNLQLCINFQHLSCEIEKVEKKSQIVITIKNQKKKFKLKESSDSEQKLEEWYQKIKQVIEDNQQIRSKQNIKPDKASQYIKSDIIKEEEFLQIAKTGDILLFKTNNFNAKLQRATTISNYDHVGIVIKLKDNVVRVFDAQLDDGVSIQEWNYFIKINDLFEKVVLRQLNYDKLKTVLPDFYQFVLSSLGQKYDISVTKLMKKRSSVLNDASREDGYFCSELAAKSFKVLGLINPNKSSCQYWPRSFSEQYESELNLYEGVKLEKERPILLNRHIFHDIQQENEKNN